MNPELQDKIGKACAVYGLRSDYALAIVEHLTGNLLRPHDHNFDYFCGLFDGDVPPFAYDPALAHEPYPFLRFRLGITLEKPMDIIHHYELMPYQSNWQEYIVAFGKSVDAQIDYFMTILSETDEKIELRENLLIAYFGERMGVKGDSKLISATADIRACALLAKKYRNKSEDADE
jgi:hypothetical protein